MLCWGPAAHVTHASVQAFADAIDARYGPRLRVVSAANGDAIGDGNTEAPYRATKQECREKGIEPS